MADIDKIRAKSFRLLLGGKERTLRYDLNAFAELEERYGTIEKAMQGLESGSIKAVRLLLWAGVLHEHMVLDSQGRKTDEYTITPTEVGSWINISELPDLSGTIKAAMTNALPEEEPIDPNV